MPDELIWSIVGRYLPWLDLTTILASGQSPIATDGLPARLNSGLGG